MQILTDFIPKPGDKIKHKMPSGQLHIYIWVVCPDCFNGRWVQETNVKHPCFTGRCNKCSTKAAKDRGWTKSGFRV